MNVGSDGYVNISSSERIVLDVFLSKPPYFPYCFTESTGKCSDFEVFSFARDLFACFCSVRVRMYLSITTEYFSDLISLLSLSDEKKIVRKIFTFAHLLLHEFFDLFGQVNASECYVKPKFGPYCGPKHSLEIIMF